MIRFIRPRIPWAASSARTAASRAAKPHVVLVHRAKVGPSRTQRVKHFALGVFALFVAVQIWDSVIFTPFVRRIADAIDVNLEEEEEEDVNLFIPVPFGFSTVPAKPFPQSDPVLKSFVTFHNDKQLQRHIRNQLADIVRQSIGKAPWLNQRFGRATNVGGWYLTVSYPDRPAPQIVQLGLTLDGWRTKPVDYQTYYRTQRALVPINAAKAVWAFSRTLGFDTVNDARVAVGLEPLKDRDPYSALPPEASGDVPMQRQARPSDRPRDDRKRRKADNDPRAMATAKGTARPPADGNGNRGGSPPSPEATDSGGAGGAAARAAAAGAGEQTASPGASTTGGMPKSSAPYPWNRRVPAQPQPQQNQQQDPNPKQPGAQGQGQQQPTPPPPNQNDSTKSSPSPPSSSSDPSSADSSSDAAKTISLLFPQDYFHDKASRPIAAFNQSLARTWVRPPAFRPRGSFMVSGIVTINMQRATVQADVSAWYDPETRTYDSDSMRIHIRSVSASRPSPTPP